MFKNLKAYVIIKLREMPSKKRLLEMDKKKRETLKNDKFATKTLAALDNPNYKWRTVKGIVKETNLSQNEVAATIERLNTEGLVVMSSGTTSGGEFLFTSKQRYLGKKYWLNRILSVLSDQVK